MDESASCGLDFDIGFIKCCGMRALAHECLVVRVACSAEWLSRQCSSRVAASVWVWDQQCQQHWPKTSVRDRRVSRHETHTDSDVRLGGFQQKGFAALMPKLSCDVWIRNLCPTPLSLSLGVRLLCLRGMVVKRIVFQ
jgi:hypothetical protein